MPTDQYEPKSYWNNRLARHPNLRGTGHHRFSVEYNEALYQVATENLQVALAAAQIDLNGKKVLDIGPGLGYFVRQYIEWGARHVTGIDITEVSVQNLQRAFPAHRFMQADISDQGYRLADQYDLVSAISVIFHIVDEDRFLCALTNMCRGVQPGGHLLISDAFRRLTGVTAHHARLRSLNKYMPVLEKNNLEIIAIRPMYFFMCQTYVAALGPLLLNHPAVFQLLVKAERWMSRKADQPSGYLRYMIARRTP